MWDWCSQGSNLLDDGKIDDSLDEKAKVAAVANARPRSPTTDTAATGRRINRSRPGPATVPQSGSIQGAQDGLYDAAMRNRAERLADRLDDVQALLRMYSEPPLDQIVGSPEIAGLILRLKCEEERLSCRIAGMSSTKPAREEPVPSTRGDQERPPHVELVAD